jgi:hypothetical protein
MCTIAFGKCEREYVGEPPENRSATQAGEANAPSINLGRMVEDLTNQELIHIITVSLQYRPNKSLNSYHEASYCMMCIMHYCFPLELGVSVS